jgi:hypothetical protein
MVCLGIRISATIALLTVPSFCNWIFSLNLLVLPLNHALAPEFIGVAKYDKDIH